MKNSGPLNSDILAVHSVLGVSKTSDYTTEYFQLLCPELQTSQDLK